MLGVQGAGFFAPSYGTQPIDLADFGITRAGDLTDLDVIGIPVWFACRPNSRSLSQSQGKGETDEAARISAIMEAMEQHFAENAYRLDGCRQGSYAQVERGAIQPMNLQLAAGCSFSRFDIHRRRVWCKGKSLIAGADVLAPYELVGLDFRVDAGWDRNAFQNSTTGLGAGATAEDAILHGLLEVVESNATVLADALGPLHSLMTSVAYRPGDDEKLDSLVDQICRAGLQVRFKRLDAPAGLPVLGAFLSPAGPVCAGEPAGTFAGYACRLSPAAAARAALLEAVQSRLTDIAGARDDIDPADYEKVSSAGFDHAREDEISVLDGEDHWHGCAGLSSAEILPQLVDALVAHGVDDICWFDL
ncbi:MAG: YcaO-like family protein, partial [Pseudomonadota bacterium]